MTEERTKAEFDRELSRLLAIEPRVSWPETPSRVQVTSKDVILMRLLIFAGVLAVTTFLLWFFGEARIGAWWLYWPLTFVLLFKLTLTLYEWFCYLGIRSLRASPPVSHRSVDVLTTWCPGEPREMVAATLKSIQRMREPHTTYLCDEGNDPLLRSVCTALGVRHVTRSDKSGAKAGNINNALRQATGEIAVIMDPDHEASPFFLERILGYFDDPKVGFVQCVQGYYNQKKSLIARGAAEQTYHFYGPLMTGMDRYGTTQAIGANCAFRREALDSIGGHAEGLAEDLHTTLKLYAADWRSVYVPEILTRGLTPNTLSAYAKQQLKWACGIWDILIETYWRVFSKISWANKIHYLHNAIFYFRGLFVLLGALIPIASLFSGQIPWEITLLAFIQWYGPVVAMQLLVRQVAQRWLVEPSERGFHLVGGILMNGAWWVHITGLICSILRIKIPYIPTPKESENSNEWLLSIPSIALVLASLAAIYYGLSWDWSPYAFLMAAFAMVNVFIHGVAAVISQQQVLSQLRARLRNRTLEHLFRAGMQGFSCTWFGLLWILRRHAAVLVLLLGGGALAATIIDAEPNLTNKFWNQLENRTKKERGDFMIGAYIPEADTAYGPRVPTEEAMSQIVSLESALDEKLTLISIYQHWGPEALSAFPTEQLEAIRRRGALPMITWEPLTHTFPEAKEDPYLAKNWKVFAKIVAGEFDAFLAAYAIRIRDYGAPVMIRFAHEPDNPAFAWSSGSYNTPAEYVAAWRYVVEYFEGMGATNVAWVWTPWKAASISDYYPGDRYVDWIGLDILNYGTIQGFGSWNSFAELYEPFREKLADKQGRILLAEFGSTDFGGDRPTWIVNALDYITNRPEIGGVVFFDSAQDQNWPSHWDVGSRKAPIVWRIARKQEGAKIGFAINSLSEERTVRSLEPTFVQARNRPLKRRVIGEPGKWKLLVDGKPFYIRGVAYAAGHDWRDTRVPTRRAVESDFAAISQMGANTIRRYAIDWSDTNLLRSAKANGLMVMLGFWLDHDIDYRNDTDSLKRIEDRVVKTVTAYRGYSAILSWTLGNETWGQLKHKFAQPELTEIRRAYLTFVEQLARRVKSLDPERPVFTSLEYSSELPGALVALSRLAPSIDGVGINAYYTPHLARLDGLVGYFAKGMPWFSSEFGPDGYWDLSETRWNEHGFALEPSDTKKAAQYVSRWRDAIVANAPRNIGGVAYAWSDRLEGSMTWFGLTDLEQRKKPAYHALRALWNGKIDSKPKTLGEISFILSDSRYARGSTVAVRLEGLTRLANCQIEWRLITEGNYKTVWSRNSDCVKRGTMLDLPATPGRFRLHASVIVGEDVVTASTPILVD